MNDYENSAWPIHRIRRTIFTFVSLTILAFLVTTVVRSNFILTNEGFAEYSSVGIFNVSWAVNLCPEMPGDEEMEQNVEVLQIFCEKICMPLRGCFSRSEMSHIPFLSDYVLIVPRNTDPLSIIAQFPSSRAQSHGITFLPLHDAYVVPSSKFLFFDEQSHQRLFASRVNIGSISKTKTDRTKFRWLEKWIESVQGYCCEAFELDEQTSKTVILLVIITDEQLRMVDRLWGSKIESFFSSKAQHVLIVASENIWDSGALDRLSWSNEETLHVVPRSISQNCPHNGLEILGLAFSLSLPFRFRNVITFPYNRFPLRLWTETTAISFNRIFVDTNVKIRDGTLSYSEGGKNHAKKPQEQASSSAVRAVITCQNEVCASAVPKSIPFEVLNDIFIAKQRNSTLTLRSIFKELGTDIPSQVLVGSFLHRVLSTEQLKSEAIHVEGFGSKTLAIDGALKDSALFSGALVGSNSVLSDRMIDKIEDELHQWRISLITKLEGSCREEYIDSQNLGTFPGRIFNRSMLLSGERETLKAKALAGSTNLTGVGATGPAVLIVLLSKDIHLEMLEYHFTENPKSTMNSERVLLVPEKRSMEDLVWKERFYGIFKRCKNVHSIPEELMIRGAWGGVSLVFKELIGYYYALYKWPDLSHALLLSADSVILHPKAVVTSNLCPKFSYIEMGVSSKDSDAIAVSDRIHKLSLDCGTVIPLKWEGWFEELQIAKGSQFKALSRDHITNVLLPKTVEAKKAFDKFWSVFKFMLVPDEHWIASLIFYFQQKALISPDLKTGPLFMFTVWPKPGMGDASHPLPVSLETVSNEFALRHVATRKAEDMATLRTVMNYLHGLWEHVPKEEWVKQHPYTFPCH